METALYGEHRQRPLCLETLELSTRQLPRRPCKRGPPSAAVSHSPRGDVAPAPRLRCWGPSFPSGWAGASRTGSRCVCRTGASRRGSCLPSARCDDTRGRHPSRSSRPRARGRPPAVAGPALSWGTNPSAIPEPGHRSSNGACAVRDQRARVRIPAPPFLSRASRRDPACASVSSCVKRRKARVLLTVRRGLKGRYLRETLGPLPSLLL